MNKIVIDIQDEEITSRGISSIIDFYHTLAKHEFSLSEIKAFVTGIHSPFLNVVFDLRKDRMKSAELVKSVENYFSQYHYPWGWFIIPATLNDLSSLGFTLIEESPAMYFDLSNFMPKAKSNSIIIEEVQEKDDLKKWIQPINEGFQAKENDDSFRKLNADLLNKGEKKLRHFIAYYKETLAGAGTLFLSKDAVMIHNVATKIAFQRCGVATALTIHMMELAKNLKFKHCYLDSSSDAYKLYKKIGFKTYSTTLIYNK